MLRAGNAGSNTAADHIEATRLGLAQLPRHLRRRVLIRADSGGGTHDFLAWLTKPGRRLAYSVGFTITEDIQQAILTIPDRVWEPAYDAGGQVRPGAWVAEITGMLDLSGWPKGMRVIVRKERPHPGAQLRFTDIDGHRFTAFATSTKAGSSLTWNYATGAGQGARTGSAAPRTPGCATCPSRDSRRTRCGARSSRWPASCWPGCRCSPSRRRPPVGTETAAAAALHLRRAPRPRQPPPEAPPRRQLALGRPDHHRDHPPPGPRTRLTSRTHPCDQEGHTAGPWNPAPRRDSRAATLTSHRKRRRAATSSHRTKITKDAG